MLSDTYKTISKPSQGLYKDKGSKFIALAFPVYSEQQVIEVLADLRKKYYDARHHCYAYRLGAENHRYRVNDDGEPSSTGGKPIYGQIIANDLTNIIIVVVRYFGGILLGVSGLINAYRSAASDAIINSEIIEKIVTEHFEIHFEYLQMNDVMKIMKDENLAILKQEFEMSCIMQFSVRKSQIDKVLHRLNKLNIQQEKLE